MYLSLLVFLIITIYTLKNFDRGFIIAMVLSPFLTLFSLWGADVYTFYSIVCILFAVVNNKMMFPTWKFNPYNTGLLLYTASVLITGLFVEPTRPVSAVTLMLRDVINVYIAWTILRRDSHDALRTFYKVTTIWSFVFIGVLILEFVTGENPYINYVNSIGAYKVDAYIEDIRYGFKRCQSLFSMHTTLGGVAMFSIFPLIWISIHSAEFQKKRFYVYLLTGFLIFACFASGARSAMVGAVVSLLTFLEKKYLRIQYVVPLLLFSGILYYGLFADVLNDVVTSFTDTESVGGSNSEMRQGQFEIGFNFLAKSWLFGNGIYAWTEITQHTDLLGAESMWLGLMIDRGLLGLISVIVLLLTMAKYVWNNNSRHLMFYIIAYILFNSLSSIPNLNLNHFVLPLAMMVIASRETFEDGKYSSI